MIRSSDIVPMLTRCATNVAVAVGVVAFAASSVEAGSPGAETTPVAKDLCAVHGENVKCITVLIDHLQRLDLPGGVSTMLIGNPAIADVNVLSDSHAVVNARSVGSTNILMLDQDGGEVAHYVLFVREPEMKRVTLRRGPGSAALYQCAPRCERTLTQNDSKIVHDELAEILGTENSLNNRALNQATADPNEFDEPTAQDQRQTSDAAQ